MRGHAGTFSKNIISLGGIIQSGLVLHLDAGDSISYSGTGNTWTDLSSSGHNATLVGSPTYNTVSGLSSFEFNGSTQYASVDSSNWGSNSFSISFWVKFGTGLSSAGYQMLLSGSDYANGSGGLGHYLYNNSVKTWVDTGSYSNVFTSSSILNQSEWYNLVLVREYGVGWEFYLDNTLLGVSSQRLTNDLMSSNSYIASHYNIANNFNFKGEISELLIYDKELSITELTQNWNAKRANYGK